MVTFHREPALKQQMLTMNPVFSGTSIQMLYFRWCKIMKQTFNIVCSQNSPLNIGLDL